MIIYEERLKLKSHLQIFTALCLDMGNSSELWFDARSKDRTKGHKIMVDKARTLGKPLHAYSHNAWWSDYIKPIKILNGF